MSSIKSRHQLKSNFSDALAGGEVLRNEFETSFELRKLKWKRTSPRRRMLENRFEDRLEVIDHALLALRKAVQEL